MKIVHLTPSFWPQVGGVETHVLEVCRELIAKGHECQVLTTRQPSTAALRQVSEGISIHRLVPARQSKLATWQAIWQHRHLLMAADVVQVHDVAWWLIPVWWLVLPKLFITFHGWETAWPIRWQAKAQRWLWAHLSQGTIHVGDWISRYYWDWPTMVTYGGVRLPVGWKKRPAASKHLRFVFLGRLAADNDMAEYLTLIHELRQQLGQDKVSVTWIGDGPLRSPCAAVGTVTGWLADPWVELRRADVIGASSYLALWQALAVGGPVCSLAQLPLKADYLASFPAARWLLTGKNGHDVAQHLIQLLNKPAELKAYRQAAQEMAAAASWDKVAHQYLTLWQKN